MNKSQLSPHAQRVAEFMRAARQEVPDFPQEPAAAVRELRAKLIYEEALETIKGLGVAVIVNDSPHGGGIDLNDEDTEARFTSEDHPFDLVEAVDGCLDVMVVTTGTLLAMGVPDAELQELVDQNNLAKFGPGHSFREDGKLIKPPGHQPPDIRGVLARLLGL